MLNVKNKNKPGKLYPDCDFKLDIEKEERYQISKLPLHNAVKTRASQNVEYPRPTLICETQTTEYDIFKRW